MLRPFYPSLHKDKNVTAVINPLRRDENFNCFFISMSLSSVIVIKSRCLKDWAKINLKNGENKK